MMDLRYHLASLMSIFLALAVGIVVGVSLGSSERQAATIQRLQQDVAAIRAEDSRLKEANAELRRLLAAREAAQMELLPLAIRGRLAGNRVALLLTGDAAVLAAPVTRALRLADAEVAVTIHLPRGETARDGDASSDDEAPPGPSDPAARASPGQEPAEEVASTVVRALLLGRADLLAVVRAREPRLSVRGRLASPIRRFLLICPNNEPAYARRAAAGGIVEAAVARAVRDAAGLLVAAETEHGRLEAITDPGARPREPVSLLPALAALGASTVDNIDSLSGQIAMVLALAGSQGAFGTGPSADRPLPPLSAPE